MAVNSPGFNRQLPRRSDTLKLVDLAVGTHVFSIRSPQSSTTISVSSSGGTASVEYTYDPDRTLSDGVAAPGEGFAAGIISRTWEAGASADAQETIRGPVTAIRITVATAVATVVVAPSRAKARVVSGLAEPDTIANLAVWWDVSERDGNFVFSDLLRTVPITNGGLVRGVDDRSGNGIHATIEADGNRGTWRETGQNGIGTLDCTLAAGAPGAPKAIETDNIGTFSQPHTMVGVGRIAALDAVERHALFGMTQSTGTEMRITRIVDTGVLDLTTIGVGSSNDGHGWGANAGEWWMFLMTIDGASSGVQYGSNGSPTIQDETPAFDDHNAAAIVPNTLRFGAGVDGIPNIRSGWNEDVGEIVVYDRLLTADEKNTLVTYFNDKWDLTTTSI